MGWHYAWATLEAVDELTLPQALMYLRRIPDRLYEAAEAPLMLAYSFEAFKRGWGKTPPPMPKWWDFVPASMRPFAITNRPPELAPFSLEVAAAWSLAMRLGIASNYAFARLGIDNLKASGWPTDLPGRLVRSMALAPSGKPAFLALATSIEGNVLKFEKLCVDHAVPGGVQDAAWHDAITTAPLKVVWPGNESEMLQPGLYDARTLTVIGREDGLSHQPNPSPGRESTSP